jgi:hypothetical protein
MAAKLSQGDTVAMQGEITHIYDDGTVHGAVAWPYCADNHARR